MTAGPAKVGCPLEVMFGKHVTEPLKSGLVTGLYRDRGLCVGAIRKTAVDHIGHRS